MVRNVTAVFFYSLAFFLYLSGTDAVAQKRDTSVHKRRDTLDIYRKIQKFAYRHKFTTLLYHSVFVDPAPQHYEEKPLSDEQKAEDPNLPFKDKVIREIKIEVLDPFGYSVNDTARAAINPVQKIGNHYHIKTRRRIINNLLLFKLYDKVDLTKISESERLLRGARYINDARIYITQADTSSDSVSIKVVAQDKWTVDAPFGVTPVSAELTLRDRNLLGLGQTYGQYASYNISSQRYDLRGNYQLENLYNTYITTSVNYETTKDMTQVNASFDRPFYSPLAKWAGGVSGGKSWGSYVQEDSSELIPKRYAVNVYSYDTWLARSIMLPTSEKQNRRLSNIIVAARYAGSTYQDRPPPAVDTGKAYTGSGLYLMSVGFSLSKYYKDEFIFRFGANEDIPEGIVVQATVGLSTKERAPMRYYYGFEISRGKHFDFGYLSAYFTTGTFFNKSLPDNSALNMGISYFTDLYRRKKWYFRQFAYYKFTSGLIKTPPEKITISSGELYGFNSGSLSGNNKMILDLESVMYTPYNIIGFRFAPVVMIGLGILETDKVPLFRSPVYQGYSLGVLFRNENLLSSSFQFTVGYYPNLPDAGSSKFKINPVTSFSVRFRSFSTSRPSTVSYE